MHLIHLFTRPGRGLIEKPDLFHKIKIRIMLYKKLLLCLLTMLFAVSKNGSTQRVDSLLLKNYRPQAVNKIPVTKINQARFPVIEIHSHPYAGTVEEIGQWIKMMNHFGIEKTFMLTQSSGAKFDSIYKAYSKFGNRFEVGCGFDFFNKIIDPLIL